MLKHKSVLRDARQAREKNFKNDNQKKTTFFREREASKMKENEKFAFFSRNESGFCRCFVCLFHSISHDPADVVYTHTHMEIEKKKIFKVEQ